MIHTVGGSTIGWQYNRLAIIETINNITYLDRTNSLVTFATRVQYRQPTRAICVIQKIRKT